MFCQKSLELVKDLKRAIESGGGGGAAIVPPFDDDRLRSALEEMRILFAENKRDVDEIVRASQGVGSSGGAPRTQSENAPGTLGDVDVEDEPPGPGSGLDEPGAAVPHVRQATLDHTTSFNATAVSASRRSLNSSANATDRHELTIGSSHRAAPELGAALMPRYFRTLRSALSSPENPLLPQCQLHSIRCTCTYA